MLLPLCRTAQQAANHVSRNSRIQLPADGRTEVIFLSDSPVRYTWTVTQVTVQEKVKFTLAATFAARLPVPVVTVDPMVVSIDELELGEMTGWTYAITNHGLIRATGFTLTLPHHEYLTFKYQAHVGPVEANTTVYIPVEVVDTRQPGRRRRSTGGCYVGSAIYSYECGGSVLKTIGLTFSGGAPCNKPRSPPVAPMLPVGSGSSSGGGGCIGGCSIGAISSSTAPTESVTHDYCASHLLLFRPLVVSPAFARPLTRRPAGSYFNP